MSGETKQKVVDKKIFMDEEAWNDLRNGKSLFALNAVVSAIKDELNKDGAFLIENANGIVRHVHRLSDWEEYANEINQERKSKGLEAN